jgi:hypothetical protein
MVQNVTLSAETIFIRKARERAQREHRSLNALFREWVAAYAGGSGRRPEDYRDVMARLGHVRAGKSFSRDELNEG